MVPLVILLSVPKAGVSDECPDTAESMVVHRATPIQSLVDGFN
jgi:hypothetical protein